MKLEQLRNNKEKIRQLAEMCGVFDIRIFGSVARGDANSGSDIDMLVKTTPGTGISYFRFKSEVEDLLGVKVDVVTENAIRDCIFKADIMRDAIPL